jgi:hypothetical protein
MLDQFSKQRRRIVYSTEGDDLHEAHEYSDRSQTEHKQKYETQRKASTSKLGYNSVGEGNSSPEIIFVLNNTEKLRLIEDSVNFATEKPDRYKSITKNTVKADHPSFSTYEEPSITQSINAVKRPPRPLEKNLTARIVAPNSEITEDDTILKLDAKYILLKYMLSDARIKVLQVRQVFERLKTHSRIQAQNLTTAIKHRQSALRTKIFEKMLLICKTQKTRVMGL